MNIEQLRDWLDAEIAEAVEIQAQINNTAEATEYSDWDNEVARLNQEGFVIALQHVRRQLP